NNENAIIQPCDSHTSRVTIDIDEPIETPSITSSQNINIENQKKTIIKQLLMLLMSVFHAKIGLINLNSAHIQKYHENRSFVANWLRWKAMVRILHFLKTEGEAAPLRKFSDYPVERYISKRINKERISSILSTTTVSSEESTCTAPKQLCIDVDDTFNDYNKENILD
ncbi:unnamed protein product, partial [Rotaria socialis]